MVKDVKIEYDEKANYRLCVGNLASAWVPYTHIAVLDNMVAFSEYFDSEIIHNVYVLYAKNVNVENSVKL